MTLLIQDPVSLARAYMLRDDFVETMAHPQVYDWKVACCNYRHSYQRWLWENAYSAAREHIKKEEGREENSTPASSES